MSLIALVHSTLLYAQCISAGGLDSLNIWSHGYEYPSHFSSEHQYDSLGFELEHMLPGGISRASPMTTQGKHIKISESHEEKIVLAFPKLKTSAKSVQTTAEVCADYTCSLYRLQLKSPKSTTYLRKCLPRTKLCRPVGAHFILFAVFPGFHIGLCPHSTLGYAGVSCLRLS